ncbi:MAG: prepilin-type N-terminal cleavage/methylation domain-containing protein [Acidobacteria bacterium]|nr:prepilin-type N-terminal cleavage/methylation domain-containing protein [Acidobacteriota bacterium]
MRLGEQRGFTLIETMVAMVILIFGVIAVSNLFIVAVSNNALARSKTTAMATAQQRMDELKRAYVKDPSAFPTGIANPITVQVKDPLKSSNNIMSEYTVSYTWAAGPGNSKTVEVTVRPTRARAGMNKTVILRSIFSLTFEE